MATIKEMADDYVVHNIDAFDDYDTQYNAYICGANFVLDEIEKALFANIRYKDNFMDVRAKIKELRGK